MRKCAVPMVLLLCTSNIGIILVIHNEEPGMLQVIAENKYPDQPDIHHFRDIQPQPMPTQHPHPRPLPLSPVYLKEQRITAGNRRLRAMAPGAPSASAVCGYTRTFMAMAVLSAVRPRMPATAALMASFPGPEEICSIRVAFST